MLLAILLCYLDNGTKSSVSYSLFSILFPAPLSPSICSLQWMCVPAVLDQPLALGAWLLEAGPGQFIGLKLQRQAITHARHLEEHAQIHEHKDRQTYRQTDIEKDRHY